MAWYPNGFSLKPNVFINIKLKEIILYRFHQRRTLSDWYTYLYTIEINLKSRDTFALHHFVSRLKMKKKMKKKY